MRCLTEMSAATDLTRRSRARDSYKLYCRAWRLLGSLAWARTIYASTFCVDRQPG
jgi:hypothetical protein